MKRINRYVFSQLVAVTLGVTVALTIAVWLTQSLRLIDYIVNRGLPATSFFTFVGLLLPHFLGIALPIAAFCAVLFVYHKMIVDSELVALRSAGLSQLQLAKPALMLAVLVTLLVYSISLYFLPLSYRAFKDLQNQIRNDYSTVLLQEGVFNTLSDEITVYIRERAGDGELRGILVHDNREPEQPVTMTAERGALIQSASGPRVVMQNGNRQQMDRETGRLSVLYFDRYTVDLALLQENVGARWREPRERYLSELFFPEDNVTTRRLRNELTAEGHQRLVAPLYVLVFVLVALAALLSGEFNRRGQTRRVLLAILCVAVLEGLSLALHDLAIRSPRTVPVMYGAVAAVLAVSLAVLHRKPRRQVSTALQVPAGAR